MVGQVFVGLVEVNHVVALAQNEGGLHARGVAAYHQHGTGLRGFREFLGMPAAAVFLADGDVLSAHDLAALLELGDTDVAADALADILDPAFRNLGRQEGICDRGTGGADDVQHAGTYQSDHVVGAGEPAVADHGNVGAQNRLSLFDEWRHPAGFAEARYPGILAPLRVVSDLQRHRVDHALFSEQFQHSHTVFASFDPFGSVQSVDLEARRNTASIAE